MGPERLTRPKTPQATWWRWWWWNTAFKKKFCKVNLFETKTNLWRMNTYILMYTNVW